MTPWMLAMQSVFVISFPLAMLHNVIGDVLVSISYRLIYSGSITYLQGFKLFVSEIRQARRGVLEGTACFPKCIELYPMLGR